MSVLLRCLAPALLFTLALAVPAAAQCTSTGECILPPGGCVYVGPNTVFYPGGHSSSGLILEGVMTCDPLPPVGGSIDSFFDVFFELELDTGMGSQTYHGQQNVGVRIRGISDVAGVGTFETEILSMELTGGTMPPNLKVRESPVQPSVGQLVSTDLGGGFHIDSFFDVFTEVTLDFGTTWLPGTSPSQLKIVPNTPTPAQDATWGAVKAFYR